MQSKIAGHRQKTAGPEQETHPMTNPFRILRDITILWNREPTEAERFTAAQRGWRCEKRPAYDAETGSITLQNCIIGKEIIIEHVKK